MLKAHEVMTHALATCEPDANLAQVSGLMRDRDVGDVLVVENGELLGIITDRDLAVNALSGEDDPLRTPVRKYMTTGVVTGSTNWPMKQVAKIMAKHQIRRLPILHGGQLAGIISLGDVALHENRKGVVSKSLRAISKPNGNSHASSVKSGVVLGVGLAALAATIMSLLTWNQSGQAIRKQIENNKYFHAAEQAAKNARDKIDEVGSSKMAHNLRRKINSNLHQMTDQMSIFTHRPSKRKHVLFN